MAELTPKDIKEKILKAGKIKIVMSSLSELLKSEKLKPNVAINPDFDFLGTETAFGFKCRSFGKGLSPASLIESINFISGDTGPRTPADY